MIYDLDYKYFITGLLGEYICKDGWCVNTTTYGSLNQTLFTTYGCDNLHVCNNNNPMRECNTGNSSSIRTCCCDNGDYCNKPGYTPPKTIKCYNGIENYLVNI